MRKTPSSASATSIVFAASNDGLALGAVRAVQSAGKGDKIKVYGAGATLMGMQAVYDGQMRYTTIKSQAKMAARALEFVDLLTQKKPITNKMSLIPPVVVTKDNVRWKRTPCLVGPSPIRKPLNRRSRKRIAHGAFFSSSVFL